MIISTYIITALHHKR